MILKLFGLVSIPHELLHVLGFRLIGKRCAYQLGDFQVKPIDPLTKGERLFVTLFPFGVAIILYVGLLASMLVLADDRPVVAIILGNLTIPVGLYVFFALDDLRQAYRLMTGRQKTPFGFIFQFNEIALRSPKKTMIPLWIIVGIVLVLVFLLQKSN